MARECHVRGRPLSGLKCHIRGPICTDSRARTYRLAGLPGDFAGRGRSGQVGAGRGGGRSGRRSGRRLGRAEAGGGSGGCEGDRVPGAQVDDGAVGERTGACGRTARPRRPAWCRWWNPGRRGPSRPRGGRRAARAWRRHPGRVRRGRCRGRCRGCGCSARSPSAPRTARSCAPARTAGTPARQSAPCCRRTSSNQVRSVRTTARQAVDAAGGPAGAVRWRGTCCRVRTARRTAPPGAPRRPDRPAAAPARTPVQAAGAAPGRGRTVAPVGVLGLVTPRAGGHRQPLRPTWIVRVPRASSAIVPALSASARSRTVPVFASCTSTTPASSCTVSDRPDSVASRTASPGGLGDGVARLAGGEALLDRGRQLGLAGVVRDPRVDAGRLRLVVGPLGGTFACANTVLRPAAGPARPGPPAPRRPPAPA